MASSKKALLRPRRLLVVSLLLLYVAFILFGWQWSTLQGWWQTHWLTRLFPQQLFWPTGMVATLSVTGLFTKPLYALRRWARQLLGSDTRLFFGIVLLTSFGILLLVNLAILAEVTLILGVIWLARFDLRLIKVRGWRQFAILGSIALLGFLGGGWLHWSWLTHGFDWVQAWLQMQN